MKTIALAIAGISGLLALVWLAQGSDLFMTSVFAPKYEAVRRQTFEQSKAYNEGMIHELRSAQLDYVRAKSDAERQALAAYVLHEVGGYGASKLPSDLQAFVSELSAEVSK